MNLECFVEDLFLGGQWSIILGYRRLSVKSLLVYHWFIFWISFLSPALLFHIIQGQWNKKARNLSYGWFRNSRHQETDRDREDYFQGCRRHLLGWFLMPGRLLLNLRAGTKDEKVARERKLI